MSALSSVATMKFVPKISVYIYLLPKLQQVILIKRKHFSFFGHLGAMKQINLETNFLYLFLLL